MALDTSIYKEKLSADLAEITEELGTLGIHNPDNPQDWVATPEKEEGGEADPNVAADRVEDWEERRATLAQLERQYNDITRALQKISDGTYGICEIGNEPIEPDRLSANPAARTCKKHINDESTLAE